MVEMHYIDSISHTSIGKVLRENSLKPYLVELWCILIRVTQGTYIDSTVRNWTGICSNSSKRDG